MNSDPKYRREIIRFGCGQVLVMEVEDTGGDGDNNIIDDGDSGGRLGDGLKGTSYRI